MHCNYILPREEFRVPLCTPVGAMALHHSPLDFKVLPPGQKFDFKLMLLNLR